MDNLNLSNNDELQEQEIEYKYHFDYLADFKGIFNKLYFLQVF